MRAHKRIETIAGLIENAETVADIGADHGFLSKLLIEQKRAKKVIATDISAKSLKKTENLIKRFNLEDKIETRVGDGLEPIEVGEAEIVVIAGMGGYEMMKILSSPKSQYSKRFILQPAQTAIELRVWLTNNNYKIIKDFIVKDQNKFYNTLEVIHSLEKQQLSKLETKYGLTNFDLRSNDFKEYLEDGIRRIEAILLENRSLKLEEELNELKMLAKKYYSEGEENARNY